MIMAHHRQRAIAPPKSVASIPRWARPKLTAGQLRDLSMAHHANLDAISRGEADAELLWQWTAGIVTWAHVAKRLAKGEAEIAPQLELTKSVVERFKRTGLVGFSGPEYQLARDGVIVMDLLAAAVDVWTAGEAAAWAERQVQRLADEQAREVAA